MSYEHCCRRRAYQRVREDGENLMEALEEAIKDSELKEIAFTSPLALMSRKRGREEDRVPREDRWRKGGKGRGASGKGQKGKGQHQKVNQKSEHKQKLWANTPDGRQICFAYNSADGCQKAQCDRVHVCRVAKCGKNHPMGEHS